MTVESSEEQARLMASTLRSLAGALGGTLGLVDAALEQLRDLADLVDPPAVAEGWRPSSVWKARAEAALAVCEAPRYFIGLGDRTIELVLASDIRAALGAAEETKP